jgi:hypothetical protein
LVAGRQAQRVVDRPERVHVKQDERSRGSGGAPSQFVIAAQDQRRSVRQARQRIVDSLECGPGGHDLEIVVCRRVVEGVRDGVHVGREDQVRRRVETL